MAYVDENLPEIEDTMAGIYNADDFEEDYMNCPICDSYVYRVIKSATLDKKVYRIYNYVQRTKNGEVIGHECRSYTDTVHAYSESITLPTELSIICQIED